MFLYILKYDLTTKIFDLLIASNLFLAGPNGPMGGPRGPGPQGPPGMPGPGGPPQNWGNMTEEFLVPPDKIGVAIGKGIWSFIFCQGPKIHSLRFYF